MRAAVTTSIGDPEVIQLMDVPKPEAKPGWVLIRVMAFGLNRSEMYTRQGHSPSVEFPRIQGIECVGLVEEDPSGTYKTGQQVAAIMGEMGRAFDGGYAEFTLVPLRIVFPFKRELPWSVLGAIPEMFQTVSGSLNGALEIKAGEKLLIRGGTSSIGMLSCQLAKLNGLHVISTTRKADKRQHLLDNGADEVIIDTGEISEELRELHPKGVNKVLELIGTRTLLDSLKCISAKGVVCMTGILGNEWTMKEFTPMGDIPSMGKLTAYMGDAENLDKDSLQEFIDAVARAEVKLNIDRILSLEEVAEGHRMMEESRAKGKLVVVV